MKTLREVIQDAVKKEIAIPHFNVATMEALNGVVDAAKKLSIPVIIGVSEGERDFIGLDQIVALVASFRAEGLPIYLNADHTYSFERVKEAIDAGFDAVIFDGAKLSLEENIAQTKKCVEYARSSGRDVLVEGELGYIGQSSKVLDAIPEGVSLVNLTTPDDALRFVKETGVDLFAPAVGNIHGMLRASKDPRLNIERVKEISLATGVPLVLHGGSGTEDEDFVAAIKAGMAIVHVSTELRVALKEGIHEGVDAGDEIAPYKYMKPAREHVAEVAEARARLFVGM